MRICGVEIKGNDAIICLLNHDDGLFSLPACRVAKVDIRNTGYTDQLRHFQQTFAKLMTDYKVDRVVIKERPMKGKFAGSAAGFKLEAAIQLQENIRVDIISATEIKDLLKKHELTIDFKGTGLKKMQEIAFNTAFAYLSARNG